MASSRKRSRSQPAWVDCTDEELLDLRFKDLRLKIEESPIPRRMDRIHRELSRRGLRFRPHCWLGEEWFSPDGIPGVAVPFYLAHPRLIKLQNRMMLEVEGGTDAACMRLLRHETGHAIDSAFRLHRRKRWRELFGSFSRPYPDYYRPKPFSRKFVLHLDWWYAQAHPAEDFAETFAVWLKPGSPWRKQYADWPALRKLEYVAEVMKGLEGKSPPVKRKERVRPVSQLTRTLREHYDERRAHYGASYPEIHDRDLRRLFTDTPSNGLRRRASAFLRQQQTELRRVVARGTGEHPYAIDNVLREMIGRCRELKLYLDRPDGEVAMEAAVMLSVRTMNYLHESGGYRVPV